VKSLFLLLALPACTGATISLDSPDGRTAHVDFNRFMSSVSFVMLPDGTLAYSSDPTAQGELLAKLADILATR
jgi:hypothetical protein